MLQELNNIKEQLFDAPVDVKRSFNTLIQYFASAKSGKSGKGTYYGGPKNVFKIKPLRSLIDAMEKLTPEEFKRYVYNGAISGFWYSSYEGMKPESCFFISVPYVVSFRSGSVDRQINQVLLKFKEAVKKSSKLSKQWSDLEAEEARLNAKLQEERLKKEEEAKREREKRKKRWESRGLLYSPWHSFETRVNDLVSNGVDYDIAEILARGWYKRSDEDAQKLDDYIKSCKDDIKDVIKQYQTEESDAFYEASRNAAFYNN